MLPDLSLGVKQCGTQVQTTALLLVILGNLFHLVVPPFWRLKNKDSIAHTLQGLKWKLWKVPRIW